MALSDTVVRAIKPSDKPYKVHDRGGLFLMVNPMDRNCGAGGIV